MEDTFSEISIKEWPEWKKANKGYLLLDIREKDEFQDFNIGGLNVPAHLINDHIAQISEYEKIVVACSNGLRSSILARVIKKKIPKASIFHLTEGIFEVNE